MKIIDRKTGKRIKDADPIQRNAEKDQEVQEKELSPMDPPEAYGPQSKVEGPEYDDMPYVIKYLMDEHQHCLNEIKKFEDTLIAFRTGNWHLDQKKSKAFADFFEFLDNSILTHNEKEEKVLFPLLQERLMENGEHSQQPDNNGKTQTPIDIMEDDHTRFAQLSTLVFNFLGLAPKLPDLKSGHIVYYLAYEQARELIERLRLHIYQEDNTLFPLAVKFIKKEEFDTMHRELQNLYHSS